MAIMNSQRWKGNRRTDWGSARRSGPNRLTHGRQPESSQPGWPIYVLFMTLSVMALLTVRSIQPNASNDVSLPNRFNFLNGIFRAGPDAELAQVDRGESQFWRNQHWDDRLPEYFGSLKNEADDFFNEVYPCLVGETWGHDMLIAGIDGASASSTSASGASANRPVRIPIWRQAFWRAHVAIAKPILVDARTATIRALEGLPAQVHSTKLWMYDRTTDIAMSASIVPPVTNVFAPVPPPRPSLIEVADKSPGRPWLESWMVGWFRTTVEATDIHLKQQRAEAIAAREAASRVPATTASTKPEATKPAVEERSIAPRRTAPATWPYAEGLARRVDQLRALDETSEWAEQTLIQLDRLSQIESRGSDEVAECLAQLIAGHRELQTLPLPPIATDRLALVRGTGYEMQKWIGIWQLVYFAARQDEAMNEGAVSASQVSSPGSNASAKARDEATRVLRAIEDVENHFAGYQNSGEWTAYFELDEAKSMFDDPTTLHRPNESADRILAKLEFAELRAAHHDLLDAKCFVSLRESLRPYATTEVDLSEFLWQLELYERRSWHMIERKLLTSKFRMELSENEYLNQLADYLDLHYRNANVRIAVSEEMLNRLMPVQNQQINEPVNDWILGARVSGQSNTSNQLQLKLVPDNETLNVSLYASGRIQSRTRATKGLFVFHNRGSGRYAAEKNVVITPRDLFTDPTRALASNQNQTTEVETDFDYLPLVSDLARMFATQQQSEVAPLARRIAERKIAGKAQQKIDQEVSAKLTQARERLSDELVSPLDHLALAIEPMDFRTTSERLIMRYRLAGNEQLGAFSARPQALSSSWMSMQVHESMLNNMVRRLKVDGREFGITELYEHISQVTGRPIKVPDDVDQSVVLKFAPSDGIEFRMNDGRVQVTIRFSEIRIGRSARWRNVSIEADYVPQVDGLQISFARAPESTLRLPGRKLGFRDQMAIRTIFNKVFDVNQVLPTTPEHLLTDARFQSLEVSRCEIRDGWVGLSLGPRK